MDLQKSTTNVVNTILTVNTVTYILVFSTKGKLARTDFKISREKNNLYIIQTILHIVSLSFWMLISTEYEGIFLKSYWNALDCFMLPVNHTRITGEIL